MGILMQELMVVRQILDQTMDSIVVTEYFCDEQGNFSGGKIICASSTKAKHYNLNRDSILGKTDFDLMSQEQAEKALRDNIWVMKNCRAIEDEIETITHKNGEIVTVSVTKSPLISSSGVVMGVICIARNITIREKAKQQTLALRWFMEKRILRPLESIYPFVKTSRLGKVLDGVIMRLKKKIKDTEEII